MESETDEPEVAFRIEGSSDDARGRRMIAGRDIKRSESIVTQTPLLELAVGPTDIFHSADFWATAEHSGAHILYERYQALSPDQRDAVDDLKFHKAKRPSKGRGILQEHAQLLAKMATNCFTRTAEENGVEVKALVLSEDISMINHSCAPNAVWEYCGSKSATGGKSTVHALQAIPEGTEITINYLAEPEDSLLPRAERKKNLRSIWNFTCDCTACRPVRGSVSIRMLDDGDVARTQALELYRQVKDIEAPDEAINADNHEAHLLHAANLETIQEYIDSLKALHIADAKLSSG